MGRGGYLVEVKRGRPGASRKNASECSGLGVLTMPAAGLERVMVPPGINCDDDSAVHRRENIVDVLVHQYDVVVQLSIHRN